MAESTATQKIVSPATILRMANIIRRFTIAAMVLIVEAQGQIEGGALGARAPPLAQGCEYFWEVFSNLYPGTKLLRDILINNYQRASFSLKRSTMTTQYSTKFCYPSCLPDAIFISRQLNCAIKVAERMCCITIVSDSANIISYLFVFCISLNFEGMFMNLKVWHWASF